VIRCDPRNKRRSVDRISRASRPINLAETRVCRFGSWRAGSQRIRERSSSCQLTCEPRARDSPVAHHALRGAIAFSLGHVLDAAARETLIQRVTRVCRNDFRDWFAVTGSVVANNYCPKTMFRSSVIPRAPT
jgi:hypothetical protein